MAAINFRLELWHRSFLTTIMVDHYLYILITIITHSLSLHAANEQMFIRLHVYKIKLLVLVALCYVALASPPRHQHPQCFHTNCYCTLDMIAECE